MQISREDRGCAMRGGGSPGGEEEEEEGGGGCRRELCRLVQMMSVMRFHSSHRL